MFGKKKASKMSQPQPRPAAAGKSEKDVMNTTILASSTQKKMATTLLTLLEKTGQVIVDGRSQVMQSGGSDDLIEYMQKPNVTGVVILSSKELADFLGRKGDVKLQITGQDVKLDSSVIAQAFQSNSTVRAKILVVVPNGKSNELPDYMKSVDVLELSDDRGSYGEDIVHKFMQKIHQRS